MASFSHDLPNLYRFHDLDNQQQSCLLIALHFVVVDNNAFRQQNLYVTLVSFNISNDGLYVCRIHFAMATVPCYARTISSRFQTRKTMFTEITEQVMYILLRSSYCLLVPTIHSHYQEQHSVCPQRSLSIGQRI